MASSPLYTVHNPAGSYVASCKFASDAAALVSLYGDGAKIKLRHSKVVWHEGHESQSAGLSYDFAANLILDREHEIHVKALAKVRSASA